MVSIKNFVPWLKALDWVRIGLWLLVFVLWTGFAYFKGRDHEQDKQLQAQVEQAEAITESVIAFSKVVAEKERKAAEQNARLQQKGERYSEEVDKNPRADSCDLTDSELRAFQELVEG